jgi:hypothetical protein
MDHNLNIKALVNRFLAWPLPQTVCADGCATNSAYPFPRSGTNLLTADEAEVMMRYVLAAPCAEHTFTDAASVDKEIERLLALKAARFPESATSLLEQYRAKAQSVITIDLAEVEKRDAEHLAALTAAYQQHTFKAWTANSLDGLDATVMGGDEFIDTTARMAFRWYLARWERQLKLFDASDDDSESVA